MNTPNKISICRICLVPILVAVFLIDAIPYGKFISLGIFILASLTDWLDGYLARKNNQITDLGKFLDTTADKFLVAAALILIILPLKDTEFFIWGALLAIILISRELIINGFRAVASAKGTVVTAGWLGKIKTVLQMAALILLIPYADIAALSTAAADIIFYIGFGVLCASALMSIISAVDYIVKNREVLK